METVETKKDKVLKIVKEKASKLPIGFIVGAAIGGGLYLYATKGKATKSVNAITNVAKLAAPYVIIAILDKIVDNYDSKRGNEVVDVEAEVS